MFALIRRSLRFAKRNRGTTDTRSHPRMRLAKQVSIRMKAERRTPRYSSGSRFAPDLRIDVSPMGLSEPDGRDIHGQVSYEAGFL